MRHLILTVIGLLFFLTTTAQQQAIRQGCRRGTVPAQTVQHRAGRMAPHRTASAYTGQRRQLTVLAAFNDRSFAKDEQQTLATWERIFNAKGLNVSPFKGSIHDYFYDQSYGLFDLTFDLEYVSLAANHNKYGSTASHDENSQYLVDDVVDSLLTRHIDWSRYDWDGDGYIDQLLIVYAGKGSSYGGFGGDADAIWPHQWWLSYHLDLITSNAQDFRGPRTVSYAGQTYTVDKYCAVQELDSQGDYGTFGTICHEYSHCFGFPDFYGSASVVKDWDLMDNGNYNGYGYCPAGYSAHERMLMGWLQPTVLSEPEVITALPALADEPKAYMVVNDSHESEYYILENRQPKGWDTGLPGSGILIFHIDYDPELWASADEYVNTATRKHYTLFHANNNSSTAISSMKNWAYPYQDNNALTIWSTPPSIMWNGPSVIDKPITNMTISNGLASFEFCTVPQAIDDLLLHDRQEKVVYRCGPVTFIRTADGKVRKIIK